MLALATALGLLRLSALLGVPERQPPRAATGSHDEEPTDRWTELPLPPETRDGAAHVWTGSDIIAWGGCAPHGDDECDPTADGYAFDPATQTWTDVPEAPISSSEAAGAWTGEEAVFLRFRDERPLDGAAYDPSEESWRRIRASPIKGQYGAAEVWTGEELVVLGGGERREPSAANGAAYDPKTDAWRSIPDAPVGLNATSGMWTGREVLVFGSLLDNRNHAATPTAVGAAYDPDRDRWRELPPSALSPQASSAVWVGDRVVAWDYEVQSQQYDPKQDEWTSPVRMPFDFSECYPASVPTRSFAFAFFCGRVALYDPERGSWSEIHGGLVDDEMWSKAYERYLKVWRFAELVPAGDDVYLLAQGLTLNANGVACYGCPESAESFWSYRSPETLAHESSVPPVSPASAYRAVDEFMWARTLRAEGRVRRTIVRAAAAKFDTGDGVPEPLLAGTSFSVHRPIAVAGRPGFFEVVVELTLKGSIGRALGVDEVQETLLIGPGRTMTGRIAPLAVLDVRAP